MDDLDVDPKDEKVTYSEFRAGMKSHWHLFKPKINKYVLSYNTHLAYEIHPRACLHQASELMQSQRYDDASSTTFIENNEITWEWVATPILEQLFLLPVILVKTVSQRHHSIDCGLTLTLGVNGT